MKIAVVDIETSGFQNQGGLIVEVGIVGLDLMTGEITEEFGTVVRESSFDERHGQHPFGWIFGNSTLTLEEVLAAVSFDSVAPAIQQILNKYDGATAFNKSFDFGFLNYCLSSYRIAKPQRSQSSRDCPL